MKNWKKCIVKPDDTIRRALTILNEIGVASGVLFVTDTEDKLLGSVTDGDIRRGLLRDASVDDRTADIMNGNCRRLCQDDFNNRSIREFRSKGINYVPMVDKRGVLIDILDLSEFREIVPVDVMLMAGGKGERLLPLTRNTPKPLLQVGNKPILEHTIDRLAKFGIKNVYISINYLGHLIKEYFGDGSSKGINIHYVSEESPLGTMGSVTLVERFDKNDLLVMNSDLLTNMDYSDFYNEFLKAEADMAVATIPHHVDLPYAIMEIEQQRVKSLQEKPRYTYFANAGIYLIKVDLINYLSKGNYCNATDLMEKVIGEGRKLISYPILEYWLDIGRMNDFQKAQEDIRHLGF